MLDWAAADPAAATAPPRGPLEAAPGLAGPDPDLDRALRRLAVATAARLHCSGPEPFGLRGGLGRTAAALAAALGGRGDVRRVDLVLRNVPRPVSGWDLVACHGVVAAAGRSAARRPDPAPDLLPALRRLSPLTGVLAAPDPDVDGHSCEVAARKMIETAQGRADLVGLLALPCADDAEARWRGQVLDRWRAQRPEFVLDVYETALSDADFRAAHDARVSEALGLWLHHGAGEAVRATAQWWHALSVMEQRDRQRPLLRRRLLLTDYLPGIRLAKAVFARTGGRL